MQRVFGGFPSGLPGSGLLLLRIAIGVYLIGIGLTLAAPVLRDAAPGVSAITGLLFAAGGALVIVGLLTPLVQTLVVGAYFVGLLSGVPLVDVLSIVDQRLSAILLPLAAIISIGMLGPGAYSLDAYLFGRREINLPSSRRPD